MKHEIGIPIPRTSREVYVRWRRGTGWEKGLRKR
jgi:hypothetical protein